MNTMTILTQFWHWNIPAIIITVLLVAFHYASNGYKFTQKSFLFFFGILLFLFATVSPLDFLGHYYLFSAHMTEHIMILLIIPPMLLASTDASFLNKMLNKPWFKKFGNFFFHPLIAWMMGVGSMWFWDIPSLYNLAKSSPVLQVIHMVSLLILGAIFIWPVFSPVEFKKLQPLQTALYLFTACVGCTVLGILITFAPAGLYTSYMLGNNTAILNMIQIDWGITPSIDQQIGGLIMWVPACIVYLTNILIGFSKWYAAPASGKSLD